MAIVREAGWALDKDTGDKMFRVVVEYLEESDLPDWPIDVVWKKTPVKIVLSDPAALSLDKRGEG